MSFTIQQLTRDDGTPMHAYVLPGLLDAIGVRPAALWDALNAVPTLSDDAPTAWGESPAWVPGTHPALNYRGHALRRTKQWFADLSQGVPVYKYSGWQHVVTRQTRPYTPVLEDLRTKVQQVLPKILSQANAPDFHCGFNHAIVTKYKDGRDYIGPHSDNERTFEKDSYFLVLKLGDTRDFALHEFEQVWDKKSKKMKTQAKKQPYWCEKLPAGTGVLVRCGEHEANQLVAHSVPQCPGVGVSGSIVFRSIAMLKSRAQVERGIACAVASKKNRDEAKRRKRQREEEQAPAAKRARRDEVLTV